MLSATAVVTATRLIGPGVMHTLWRDPAALGTGRLWRLLRPVLVQTDPSATTVIEVFLLCAVVGVAAEAHVLPVAVDRLLPDRSVGRLRPEKCFNPPERTLLTGNAVPLGPRIVAALALADTLARDSHGLAFLAGLILAAVWLRRDRAPQGFGGRGT